ncbi:hypothetical protein ACFPL7_02645 [Dongia soli]|uniref:Uncharacterized protein n=1 Tax=Dongia soli TaxID=600628 RepID=A0ABU5EGZ6_9PROT|nr:hypothetical protein [Dongia soli]MDY0885172.1 hypothetical protein [Dongia soli]
MIGPTGIPEILAQATKIATQGLSVYPALKQIPFGLILPFTLAPLAMWGILLVIAVYYLSVASLKAVLHPDQIDCRVLGLRRALSFSEIASIQRISVLNSLPILIIRPRAPDRPKILMPAIFDDNKAFNAWKSSFQVYQIEKEGEEHELKHLVMRDPALGATRRKDRSTTSAPSISSHGRLSPAFAWPSLSCSDSSWLLPVIAPLCPSPG